MKPYPEGCCERCKWWGAERAHDDDRPYGTCRVLAPTTGETMALPYHDPDRPEAAGPIITRAKWPWTAFDDWCGAHDPKDTIDDPREENT